VSRSFSAAGAGIAFYGHGLADRSDNRAAQTNNVVAGDFVGTTKNGAKPWEIHTGSHPLLDRVGGLRGPEDPVDSTVSRAAP
jgi:hypothetical protein